MIDETRPMRLIVVGTGGMANAHAEAFAKLPGVEIVAGVDPNPGRRMEFLARHRIERGFDSLEEALAWDGPVYEIAAISGDGTMELCGDLMTYLEQCREEEAAEPEVAEAELETQRRMQREARQRGEAVEHALNYGTP